MATTVYHDQTKAGNMFVAMTTTASAIPVTNTTSPTFLLWNRSTNKKNLVMVRYTAGWAATTEAPGNIEFAFLNAGFNLATAAPISAVTAGVVTNCLLGYGTSTVASFNTAATLTTAGTVFEGSGMSHLTTTGTATFGSFSYIYDFQESVIVPPGFAIYTVASTATASTYQQTFKWYEENQ